MDKRDDQGVYYTGTGTPTTEGSRPEGGGVGSGSDAGPNKRDPVSSSHTIGHTIAGRTVTGDGGADGSEEPPAS